MKHFLFYGLSAAVLAAFTWFASRLGQWLKRADDEIAESQEPEPRDKIETDELRADLAGAKAEAQRYSQALVRTCAENVQLRATIAVLQRQPIERCLDV